MSGYRRILALVDLATDSDGVARRAAQLARFYGATLALAAIVDAAAGERAARVGAAREQLDRLADGLGGGCEIIVACGETAETVGEVLCSWRPQLVLVGIDARHRLVPCESGAHYDLLVVGNGRSRFTGRLIDALAAAL